MAAVSLAGAPLALDGREFVVTVDLPLRAAPAQNRQTAETQIAKAASCGADDIAVVVRGMDAASLASVGDLAQAAAKSAMRLWIVLQLPDPAAAEVARSLAAAPVEGLALLLVPPKGESLDPGQRAALLAVKRQGDKLAETIRQVKRQLGSQKKLALCAALSAIAPETARGQYVPVGDLVRDGTLDLVALSDAERANFHRLCLLRDATLRAGCFLDANSIEEKRRAGQLSRTVLEAVQNDTCQLLWLDGFPIDMVAQVAPTAVEGLRQSQRKRADLEAALAKGELAVDQEVSEKNCNDQASLHGVAQSFTPSRDGACPLVQVYAAIRGSNGPLPPALHVEIRGDDHGKPGTAVLAHTDIPAAEFGLEPAYRWGSAQLDPPLSVKKGQAYWIYLTNKSHPDGNYVWRIQKDAAGPRGHAWSKRYDYTKHTWAFRVYLKKEPSK
jgi:hypothetical protein